MKTFLTHKPVEFALLLIGPSGGGKTTFALRFPRPYVISFDRNLRGPCAQLAYEGITNVAYDDMVAWDEAGKPRPMQVQYAYFNQSFNVGYTSPDIDTIVVDNATHLCDVILAECLAQNMTKTKKPEIQTWGQFLYAWKELLLKTRGCAKRVIFIAHEKVEKDEMTGMLKYFLAIPGQTAQILPTLFTDVWRCELAEEYINGKLTHKRMIRVVQGPLHEYLKTSVPSLPAMFPATQEELTKILSLI